MNKSFDLITIGGATEDLSVILKDYQLINNRQDLLAKRLLAIEYGAKSIAPESFVEYGGGAANLAVAGVRCGLKVASLIGIGDDRRGQAIIDNLKKNKVDVSLVQKLAKQQSATSLVLIGRDGEHTIITYRGANDYLKIKPAEAKQWPSQWLYISSLSGANWLKNILAIIGSRKSIAWNPGQLQLAAGLTKLRPLFEKTTILIVNQDEALQLLASHKTEKQHLADYSKNIEQLTKRLWYYGPKLLIVTADKQGTWAYDGQQLLHQPAYSVKKVIDTTGVGDAFGGTLVASLIKTNNLKKSLRLAAKQAASVLTERGAQSGLINLSQELR